MVWLDGARLPLLDLLVPSFTLKCVWQSYELINWEFVESLFPASLSSLGVLNEDAVSLDGARPSLLDLLVLPLP